MIGAGHFALQIASGFRAFVNCIVKLLLQLWLDVQRWDEISELPEGERGTVVSCRRSRSDLRHGIASSPNDEALSTDSWWHPNSRKYCHQLIRPLQRRLACSAFKQRGINLEQHQLRWVTPATTASAILYEKIHSETSRRSVRSTFTPVALVT